MDMNTIRSALTEKNEITTDLIEKTYELAIDPSRRGINRSAQSQWIIQGRF